ncbi:MAG: hypothetical protein PHC66_03820 [Candidatus Nanoarchaeia archaeon]|nr:hypothetical protein [Candidatus Nanoarchaeia archaeon]MDD5239223.1 hypothetical protein [Candidatus Nanoarchaeia archaeon]
MNPIKRLYTYLSDKISGRTAYNNETYVKPARLEDKTKVVRQHGLDGETHVKTIPYSALCNGCEFSNNIDKIGLVSKNYIPQWLPFSQTINQWVMDRRIGKAKELAKHTKCKRYGEAVEKEIDKIPNKADLYVSGEKHGVYFGAGPHPAGQNKVISTGSTKLVKAGLTDLIEDAECAQYTACQAKFVDKWGKGSPEEVQYFEKGVLIAKKAGKGYSQKEFNELKVLGWLSGHNPKRVSEPEYSMKKDFAEKLEDIARVGETKNRVYNLFVKKGKTHLGSGTYSRDAPEFGEDELIEDDTETKPKRKSKRVAEQTVQDENLENDSVDEEPKNWDEAETEPQVAEPMVIRPDYTHEPMPDLRETRINQD